MTRIELSDVCIGLCDEYCLSKNTPTGRFDWAVNDYMKDCDEDVKIALGNCSNREILKLAGEEE